jgi:hypothetical protein
MKKETPVRHPLAATIHSYPCPEHFLVCVDALPDWAKPSDPEDIWLIAGRLVFDTLEDLPGYHYMLNHHDFPKAILCSRNFPQPLDAHINENQQFLHQVYNWWSLRDLWHWLAGEPDLWEIFQGFYTAFRQFLDDIPGIKDAMENYFTGEEV